MVILFLKYFRIVKDVTITWNKKEVFIVFDKIEKH